MTPEERATKVCRDSGWTIEPWKYDLIVAAIRAAEQDARNVLLAELQAAATKSHQDASEWNANHLFVQVTV